MDNLKNVIADTLFGPKCIYIVLNQIPWNAEPLYCVKQTGLPDPTVHSLDNPAAHLPLKQTGSPDPTVLDMY